MIFFYFTKYKKLIIIILSYYKMSNPPNIPFFFYKNFTEPENLDNICPNYLVSDGIVKVYDFSNDRSRVCFSKDDKENKILLDGKIVYFPFPNSEVIRRLGKINSCKLGKEIYQMEQVVVMDHNNQEVICNIIY